MMIAAYNLLISILLPLALPVAAVVGLVSKKRRKSLLQRLGVISMPAPGLARGCRPVWVHALSVGEVRSALPLVRALGRRAPHCPVVVSASTHTGYQTACRLMGGRAGRIVYFPYDLGWSVRRAARQIDPALVIIVETDIWPNFLHHMARRRVPVVLANARLSDRSFAGYQCFGRWGRALFAGFSAVCAQSNEDARRFRRLGVAAGRTHVTGSLKFDPAGRLPRASETLALGKSLGLSSRRPVLVAGSTHRGEEALWARALAGIRKKIPTVALILAPRDPGRAEAVCRIFTGAGFSACCLKAAAGEPGTDVLVVDTLGVLGRIYALADLAYVGGSLVARGGHNPLEPAALAKPVLFGPDMADFRAIARLMTKAGGARRVADHRQLADAVLELLADPCAARQMGTRARAVFEAHGGATARTLAVVEPLWARTGPGEGT